MKRDIGDHVRVSYMVSIFPTFYEDYTGNREGWGEPGLAAAGL